jgi:hypothetical protein
LAAAWNLYVGDPTMDENAHDQRASYGFQFRPPVSSVIVLRKAEALPSVGGAAGVFLLRPAGACECNDDAALRRNRAGSEKLPRSYQISLKQTGRDLVNQLILQRRPSRDNDPGAAADGE